MSQKHAFAPDFRFHLLLSMWKLCCQACELCTRPQLPVGRETGLPLLFNLAQDEKSSLYPTVNYSRVYSLTKLFTHFSFFPDIHIFWCYLVLHSCYLSNFDQEVTMLAWILHLITFPKLFCFLSKKILVLTEHWFSLSHQQLKCNPNIVDIDWVQRKGLISNSS